MNGCQLHEKLNNYLKKNLLNSNVVSNIFRQNILGKLNLNFWLLLYSIIKRGLLHPNTYISQLGKVIIARILIRVKSKKKVSN